MICNGCESILHDVEC